jgi:GT2 family glycosyltransferase
MDGGIAKETTTAVIVNWKTPVYTIECVRALVDDGLAPSRIVIVDNASEDHSVKEFSTALPACQVIPLATNVGFARGSNIGANAQSASAYLFVNSDAFVSRAGSIDGLLRTLAHPRVGVVAARLRNPDGSLQRSVTPLDSPLVALSFASGLSRLIPDRARPFWSHRWSHSATRRVPAAIGAVLAVRAETWKTLGGFAEDTFMYSEDIDLCWRAKLAGWETWFCAEAEFVHIGSGSAKMRWNDPQRAFRVGHAQAAMIRRHMPRGRGVTTIAITVVGLWLRAALFLATGSRERAAVARALATGYVRGGIKRRDSPAPG